MWEWIHADSPLVQLGFVIQDTHDWGLAHECTAQSSGWEILPHNVTEVFLEARTGFGR
jgi:hypothetical protein